MSMWCGSFIGGELGDEKEAREKERYARRLEYFDRLWERSSHSITEAVIPPHCPLRVRLPRKGWFLVFEVMHLPDVMRVCTPAFWEEGEFSIELMMETGERFVVAVADGHGIHPEGKRSDLEEGLATEPAPEEIYRWHFKGTG